MASTAKMQSQPIFTEIEQLLTIWSKLSAQNKNSLKVVIDKKLESLSKCSEDSQAPYDLLERLIKLKDRLAAIDFGVGTIEAAISAQVEKLRAKAEPRVKTESRARAESRDTINKTVSNFLHILFGFSNQSTNTTTGGCPDSRSFRLCLFRSIYLCSSTLNRGASRV